MRILLTITLPLVRPALINAFILTFLESIVLYGAPAVIGMPARFYVMTTELQMLLQYPPQVGRAAALSIVMLAVVGIVLWLQRKFVSGRTYATIRGKGGRRRRMSLGVWRWPSAIAVAIVLLLTVYLPYWVIIETSFLAQAFRGLSITNLTFGNYSYALGGYSDGLLPIGNSLITSSIAATAAVLVGGLAAYLIERRLVLGRNILSFLAMAPAVIPGMVLAVGLLAAYGSGPIALYGTLWIIAIAYLAKYLPFAYMSCASAIGSVSEDLKVRRACWAPAVSASCAM